MESENAAPLLCGGITVYSPLRHYGVSPWMKVGVIGIGGLGHLAIQYARAFGCEVTAFSSTPEKEEEARLFGAHHFISSRDTSRMENMSASLDFIISTVHVELEWLAFINILKPNGNLCMVGVPPTPMSIPVFALIGGRKSISGSPIGNRATITEMLEFSARHGIRAKTEALPLSDVNIAIQKVRDNLARYRMVLLNH
jgi:uncharacterized zinc-type alcohol dehydrogenase-like protein